MLKADCFCPLSFSVSCLLGTATAGEPRVIIDPLDLGGNIVSIINRIYIDGSRSIDRISCSLVIPIM